jgi:hypothetical protein
VQSNLTTYLIQTRLPVTGQHSQTRVRRRERRKKAPEVKEQKTAKRPASKRYKQLQESHHAKDNSLELHLALPTAGFI